ncbi:hypothetical protein J6590_087733 [Homalodisca vitripennis]|nr:hypothetical protein J6590_087733 [Homalodisca vitripennis]
MSSSSSLGGRKQALFTATLDCSPSYEKAVWSNATDANSSGMFRRIAAGLPDMCDFDDRIRPDLVKSLLIG